MADVVVNGTVQINALPDAAPITGTEWLIVKQGTADRRVSAKTLLDFHAALKNNPHEVNKDQLGLHNVTDDAQLAISKNLSDVADVAVSRTNLGVYSKAESDSNLKVHTDRVDNPHQVTARQLGLDNVPNWSASDDYKADTDTLASSHALSALYRAIQREHPVGSIYFSTAETNPGTYLLCGGTWVKMAKGQTLVGYDDAAPARAVGSSFGSSTVQIGVPNLPPHQHTVNITSGAHAHDVVGSVSAGGGHTHGFAATTSVFDYGAKSGSTSIDGNHAHGGYTNIAGNHRHQIPNEGGGNTNMESMVESRNNDEMYRDWTTWNGDHSHTIQTDAQGNHGHTVSVAIGSHSHSVSGTTAAAPDHVHPINIKSQISSVTITGNTNNTGGGQPLSVEQPSFVVNIWTRTA